MIPSRNEAGLWANTFPGAGNSGVRTRFICDCCGAVWYAFNSFEWPNVVDVGGIEYYGCPGGGDSLINGYPGSSRCAVALFYIHHQYAMREVA